jgi:hypothetical protein
MFAALHRAFSTRSAGGGPWAAVLRYRAWLLVGLTVLFALGVRVRLRDMPLERDEGEYAYAGQLILHGLAPYKAAYTMKLPGTCAAYALSMALFGQSPAGIHIGLALVNGASIVLMFLLGRRLLDDATGVAAAVAFALLSLSPWVLGLAAHATHYVVLAALAGMLVLLHACEPRAGSRIEDGGWRMEHRCRHGSILHPLSSAFGFFLSGLCFGLAFLMKQHGLFFGLCGALYLIRTRIGQWLTGELEEVPLAGEGRRQKDECRSQRSEGSGEGPADEAQPSSSFAIRHSSFPSSVLIPSRPGRLKHELRSPARLRAELRRFLRDAGLFALGGVLPYAITCLILWSAGALRAFVFWTITYAAKYASAIPIVSGPDVLKTAADVVIGPNIVLWILPWIGALIMWWEERLDATHKASPERTLNLAGASIEPEDTDLPSPLHVPRSTLGCPRFFVTSFLLCSLASVSVGFHFPAHSFILLLPALALLTGVAVSRGLHLLRHDTTIELFLALPILGLYAIALGAAVIGNGSIWLGMSPADATRSIYGSTLFPEAARAADYVRDNSPPDARVAVLGSEPEIYFYSRRRAATGYLYMYPLMETHPYAAKMQQELIAEIERARPEFVVYVDDAYSWLQWPGSEEKLFDWWRGYWGKNLDLIQTLPVEENLERGADVNNPIRRTRHNAGTRQHILILQRRH